MRSLPRLAVVALAAAILAGCASPTLRPEDRKEACRVVVEETFARAEFIPNSLSANTGTLSGAGGGAVAGLSMGTAAIIAAPVGAVIGAGYGTACAIAASKHPDANAHFERLLAEADVRVLRRELEAGLQAPRAECSVVADSAAPDAAVEIEKVEAGMGCLFGQQEFWVKTKWRTVAKGGRVLNSTTQSRIHKSSRDVDEWFADAAQALADIERVYGEIGRSIAAQFVAEGGARR